MTNYPINTTIEIVKDWQTSSYSNNSRYATLEDTIKKRLQEMTREKHNISFLYKECLRAMLHCFSDIGYYDSEDKFIEVKCIHANAERAIAKITQEENIILPIVSVAQTVSENDNNRQKYESVLVHEKKWDEQKNRATRIVSLSPRAINIKYQVNLWCKYLADMDQILEQIRLKFNPELVVPTTFSTVAKASLDTEEIIGGSTARDKEDRILQKTLNIVLRTYIPSPKFLITSTGMIQEIKSEIQIGS
jgi:hypothetical protein